MRVAAAHDAGRGKAAAQIGGVKLGVGGEIVERGSAAR
jgi:hypothetical protein